MASGANQRILARKVDEHLHRQLVSSFQDSVRDQARIAGLCLPRTSDYLNCYPNRKLGIHLKSSEWCAVVKYRLGVPLYPADRRICPACGNPTVWRWRDARLGIGHFDSGEFEEWFIGEKCGEARMCCWGRIPEENEKYGEYGSRAQLHILPCGYELFWCVASSGDKRNQEIDQSKVYKAQFGWSQNHSIRVQGLTTM